jgi:hypothetical protein
MWEWSEGMLLHFKEHADRDRCGPHFTLGVQLKLPHKANITRKVETAAKYYAYSESCAMVGAPQFKYE